VRGVGLPTRAAFYEVAPGGREAKATLVTPYFNLNPQELTSAISGALRRSTFACYHQFAPHLAYHLRRLLELPAPDDKTIEMVISDMLEGLSTWLGMFRRKHPHCEGCRSAGMKADPC
jgi:hypothetical protein